MTSSVRPTLRFMLSHPAHVLSLGFGAGLAPVAPGTVGSLLGYPLFAALHLLPPVERAAAYVALFALGVWCCSATERALGRGDPGSVVWDEVLAMSLVLEFTPPAWPFFAAAFLVFRFFDIAKPWPIRLADRTPWAGLSIMLDDLVAAVAAIVVIVGAVWAMAYFGISGSV